MIVRRICVLLVVLVGVADSGPAQAQAVRGFVHSIFTDFKRNNCWPQPFVLADREAARAPLEMMVQSGWQRQNLLGDYHFDSATDQLTEAGQLKVKWITNEAPRPHRMIFVSRAETPKSTAARIDAVQNVATQIAGPGNVPAIIESGRSAQGWPAGRVDAIGRKFEASMPDPKLRDYEPTSAAQ